MSENCQERREPELDWHRDAVAKGRAALWAGHLCPLLAGQLHCRPLPSPLWPARPQIVCGNRAGALTILLDEHRRWDSAEALQGEERPHFLARSLAEVQAVLEQQVQLLPPPRPPQPLTD